MPAALLTRRIAIAAICLLLAAGLATCALMQRGNPLSGTGTALVGGPFTLVNQQGVTVTEKTFLGRPMLLFFGFTYCPDICPTELQVMTAALQQLGDKGRDIQPIFVSIDPARDTPQQLSDYMSNFGETWTGLTGSDEQVAAMARAYKVFYAKVEKPDAPDGYTMDHSSIIYLMAADGKFLKHFTYSTDAKALAEGIASALGR